jgi:hypothetical protein
MIQVSGMAPTGAGTSAKRPLVGSCRQLLSKSAMDFGWHSRLGRITHGRVQFWKARQSNPIEWLSLIGASGVSGATPNSNARKICFKCLWQQEWLILSAVEMVAHRRQLTVERASSSLAIGRYSNCGVCERQGHPDRRELDQPGYSHPLVLRGRRRRHRSTADRSGRSPACC